MRKINMLVYLLLVSAGGFAQTTWTLDKNHTKIGFNVVHMVISEVEGRFKEYDGTIVTKTDDFNGAEISFTAKTASVETENERRNEHLKSPDFFNAEKYPELTFKGTLVKESGKYKLIGDLTIHGTTKKIDFPVTYGGTVDTGRGQKAGFKILGTVNRKDFGLEWNNTVPTGELIVSDQVDIICKIEANKS